MRALKVVNLPATQRPLRASPGFAKKGLSTHALDLMGLCEYGCRYCSSNAGNFLRINREPFADATEQQLGERVYPSDDPDLTFRWPDVLDRLRATLEDHPRTWGTGRTLVVSMLTDGFSPGLVAAGVTRAALELVLARTSFRIRVLTKNACVGLSPEWLRFFGEHADRFVVGLSTGTYDDAWAKRVEVGTSPPTQRLKALRRLQDAGVPTFGMLCPIFPSALLDFGIDRLIAEIRPERCETVWAEPYNDRANWRHVAGGHDVDSLQRRSIELTFASPAAWSRYAINLALAVRRNARVGGWQERLVFLLYEANVLERDASRLAHLAGISLQSERGADGKSTNPAIARMQP